MWQRRIDSQRFYLISYYSNLILFIYSAHYATQATVRADNCQPIYVRWPRVRLNFPPAQNGIFSLEACKSACAHDFDPSDQTHQQCSAFNHRGGPTQLSNECQIFQKEAVQHTDGYVEADDHYTFYWKYCVNSQRSCSGDDFAFTFLSDRFMAPTEIVRRSFVASLEDCLAECLNAKNCRSVSFNRTDGGCHISEQNQLTKPAQIKINNNPNYRIDYYENNCGNVSNSFHFHHHCEENGIRIDVDSKLPYTGALYGLYDFFSCRIEPRESQEFGLFFPYPTVSNNCSDSMRYTGSDVILEVVLSTDGVEPLYFITSDDLTYQARCPMPAVGGHSAQNERANNENNVRKSPAAYQNGLTKSAKSDKIAEFNSHYGAGGAAKSQQNGVKIYTSPTTTTTTTATITTKPATPSTTTTTTTREQKTTAFGSTKTEKITTATTIPKTTIGTTTRAQEQQQQQQTTKDIYSLPFLYTKAQTEQSARDEGTRRTQASSTGSSSLSGFVTGSTATASKLVGTDIVVLSENGGDLATASAKNFTERPSSNFIEALRANSLAAIEALNAAKSTSKRLPALEPISEENWSRTTSSHASLTSPLTREATNERTTSTTSHDNNAAKVGHEHSGYRDNRRHPGLEAILDPAELVFRDSSAAPFSSTKNAPTEETRQTSSVGGIREVKLDEAKHHETVADRHFYDINNNNNYRPAKQQQQEQGKNFSFSTYVSFPSKNSISLNTGGPSTVSGEHGHNGDDLQSQYSREFEYTTTTTSPTTTTTNVPTTTTPSTTTTTTTTQPTTTQPTTTTTTTQQPITVASSISVHQSEKERGASAATLSTINQGNDGGFDSERPPAAVPPPKIHETPNSSRTSPRPPGGSPSIEETKRPADPVIFDIFHNGQTTEAVVVGSRITLTFTPYFAIPPSFMSISGCQVEPIGSLYEWEKEPLAIVKEGCQADHVGLVCPPQRTDFGIRVTVEAFRYQTTTQVQYTCLVRICPFSVCPETTCNAVEGCPGDDILTRSFGLRSRRHVSLEQIRAALAENPYLQQQLALDANGATHSALPVASSGGGAPGALFNPTSNRMSMNTSLQQQLITLGGDHLVRKRLIVVNSEEELQYYVRTGEVPHGSLKRL